MQQFSWNLYHIVCFSPAPFRCSYFMMQHQDEEKKEPPVQCGCCLLFQETLRRARRELLELHAQVEAIRLREMGDRWQPS